jgi:hypothetical protein
MLSFLLLLACGQHAPALSTASPPPFVESDLALPAPFEGRVLEVVPAGGYMYVQVGEDAESGVWVASLEKAVAEGQQVSVRPIGARSEFRSKRTGRTFQHLIFGVIS